MAILIVTGYGMASGADIPDRIVAIVGNELILKSEIDERELMAHSQFPESKKDPQLRKHLLENLVDQKIMLTKAKIDSLKIDESAIDSQASERFGSIRSGFPSVADMESRFGKPVSRIKQDIRDDIREQQLVDALRRKHIKDVSVSYAETMTFFKTQGASLPEVPEQIAVAQIIKYPIVAESAKAAALRKIRDVQQRLKAGGNFAALAATYSDDPGSRELGGDLGFVQKGELVPQFETVAFALKPGQISDPVETRFGYHLIQSLEKEGNSVHVRHILALFDHNQKDIARSIELLDGIRSQIMEGKATFADMAEKYSDDPMTARLGGMIKPSGTTGLFEVSALRPELQKIVATLKRPGEVSRPEPITSPRGDQFVAMFQLNSRVPAHRISTERDFTRLEDLAADEKRKQLFDAWIKQLRKEVLVQIMPES